MGRRGCHRIDFFVQEMTLVLILFLVFSFRERKWIIFQGKLNYETASGDYISCTRVPKAQPLYFLPSKRN